MMGGDEPIAGAGGSSSHVRARAESGWRGTPLAPLAVVLLAVVLLAVVLGMVGLGAAPAAAQAPIHPAPWALGFTLSGGAMVSADQRGQLDLSGGGTARLSFLARPFRDLGIDWLEGEARAGFSIVGPGRGEPGGILAFELAARASPELGGGLRLPIALGVGLALTGPLVRAVGSVTVGLSIPLSSEVAAGPELTLLHVVQDDGPAFTDDALLLSAGLTLLYRPLEGPLEETAPVEEPEEVTTAPRPAPPREPAGPPLHLAPRVAPPSDDAELLSLVERAVPGSTLTVVILVPPVLFDHDADVITAAGEVSLHDVLARIAEADASARIILEGHADATGDVAHNLTLSRHRAEVVADWLERHGVPAERLRITAEGASRPLVTGDSTETLAPNRRVTIRIESHAEASP
jgi:outer membrane protein OmpA-like peptidoglycan-associated protein